MSVWNDATREGGAISFKSVGDNVNDAVFTNNDRATRYINSNVIIHDTLNNNIISNDPELYKTSALGSAIRLCRIVPE